MEAWERYTYRVFWSEEDEELVGVCAELPGLSWLADTAETALDGIRRAVAEALDIFREDGDPVPTPVAAGRAPSP